MHNINIQPNGCKVNTIIWLYRIINYNIRELIYIKYYNDRVRELREDRDLTQLQVSEILGIKQQVYSRYELGIRPLPIEHLIKLCKYYKVSADWLLGLIK